MSSMVPCSCSSKSSRSKSCRTWFFFTNTRGPLEYFPQKFAREKSMKIPFQKNSSVSKGIAGIPSKKGEFLFLGGGSIKLWRQDVSGPIPWHSHHSLKANIFLKTSPRKNRWISPKKFPDSKKNTDSKETDGRGTCCRMGLLLEKPKPSKKSSRLRVGPMGSSRLVGFVCLQNVGQDVGASQSWATRCGL